MPIVDGKVVRARYTSLKLNEVSSVDRPAQTGALAVIMKRHDPESEVSSKREETMPKTVEQLEADLAKRDETITALTADLAKAKQCATDAEDMLDGGKDEATETKKQLAAVTKERDEARAELTKATDEVITVGGTELRKSAVGVANFSVAKALADERDMAKFEKRADAEFGNLVGTTAEKALVLKAIEAPGVSDEARKAALAIFTAAEKMTAAGFDRLGTGHGAPHTSTASKAAVDGFETKVSEIEKRDGITRSAALSKARRENPEEFAAYNGESVN